MTMGKSEPQALNGICPYFTMFPLDFPLGILKRQAREGDIVLDPFCGRGTTNFAARLVGLSSLGVDSSPVATAITSSKLVKVSANDILTEAHKILAECKAQNIPTSKFWRQAFHPDVLDLLCRFREAFLYDCTAASRVALRGIILGALHGPKRKTLPSYFSNQCPRTYAPKPAYAMRYWRDRKLSPDRVDVLSVIERRAKRFYESSSDVIGTARLADSRSTQALQPEIPQTRFDWVITSPPYYGMQTYIPDQWLRNWFVGGPDTVDYTRHNQMTHSSPSDFVANLRQVWHNVGCVSADSAKMVIRFGSLASQRTDSLDLIKESLYGNGWRITTIKRAGTAAGGNRQADTFLRTATKPKIEYDIWAVRC